MKQEVMNGRHQSSLAAPLLHAAIIFVSASVAYFAYEIYARVELYEKVVQYVEITPMWVQNQSLTRTAVDDIFERKIEEISNGLFKVNERIDFAAVFGEEVVLDFSVNTNNHGLMSDRDYVVERDPEHPEYRIAVFGDSLTGSVTATYQSVDTIEELLNYDPS